MLDPFAHASAKTGAVLRQSTGDRTELRGRRLREASGRRSPEVACLDHWWRRGEPAGCSTSRVGAPTTPRPRGCAIVAPIEPRREWHRSRLHQREAAAPRRRCSRPSAMDPRAWRRADRAVASHRARRWYERRLAGRLACRGRESLTLCSRARASPSRGGPRVPSPASEAGEAAGVHPGSTG
jgi:hypothetical protein